MRRALIIGGGISGLSAAFYLSKSGIRPALVEKAQLGGVIQTAVMHGCVLEAGPDSFIASKPWAMDLIRAAGLADQVIGSNDHLRVTYILKRGRLIPLPDGLMMMVPTKILPLARTPLLSWRTKIRMALECLRRPQGIQPDRSVYEFLLDHYGEESVDYLAEPLLSGIYGGDPKQMSANCVLARFVELEAKYGSLTRGVLAEPRPQSSGSLFQTLKNGLGQLVEALKPSADATPGTAEALERINTGFRVRVNGNWMEADHIVVATPAHHAAELLKPLDSELAGLLEAIPYTPALTLSLGYRKDAFDHPLNGHGFLIPKRERQHLAACTWVGNKFSHRVPEDLVLLRCFMGGDSLRESDESLAAIARQELRRVMGLQTEPFFYSVKRWPNAMAQYTVGHERRLERIESLCRNIPGLHLIGNAYRGIGIPDCIRMGKEAAARITS